MENTPNIDECCEARSADSPLDRDYDGNLPGPSKVKRAHWRVFVEETRRCCDEQRWCHHFIQLAVGHDGEHR